MISKARSTSGFSLIELMIVVAIIAILAVIATQSYTRYAYRARRVDGQEILLRVANAQERYYATFNKYAADPVADLKFGSTSSEKGYYTVALKSTDATADYTATATPTDVQKDDACGALSVTSANVKAPLATATAKNSNGRCW